MKIEKDRVVRFHYAVAEAGKESVENSKDGGQPLAILFGHGNIIPGLEKAMDGREAGESFKTTVPAADAYGAYDPRGVRKAPVHEVPHAEDLPVGEYIAWRNPVSTA